MSRVVLPRGPGSYRWYYVDATDGQHTAVAIFMVGSLFSSRYAAAWKHGAEPTQHAAVNFALYRGSERLCWVLSEYSSAQVTESGTGLTIGGSSLHYPRHGELELQIRDHTARWARPIEASVKLEQLGPGHAPLRLIEGLGHFWHPIAPHARAHVSVPSFGLELEARAYHDGNFGPVPLGSDLRGWDWERSREGDCTTIAYRPWHDGAAALTVTASSASIVSSRHSDASGPRERTAWGLSVPLLDGPHQLLESSPFYARRQAQRGERHALGEVADFARFHSPWVRWMASLRTRVHAA